MPKVFIASDHAGFELKQSLIPHLESLGHEVVDCGADAFNPDDDYPDFVTPCATQVAATSGSFGIVLGASGQGEAMAANRIPGVRAAVYYGAAGKQTDVTGKELDLIASVREHNDANILSLGARFLSVEDATAAVERFLSTTFPGEDRHVRRRAKLG